jgi:creatinine amidohydrolase
MNSPRKTNRTIRPVKPESCRFWADLSTRDFSELDTARTIAVLPVAATEQHGPHLPLNVDTVIVDSIIRRAMPLVAPRLSVLILPTQVIGKSNEHSAFPGTLSFTSETILRIWTEIGDAVAAAGIRKLVLFNSHGGQVSVMDLVARDLREKHGMIVVSSNWYNLPIDMSDFSAHEMRFGIHAGEVETSMLLAASPHLVNMRRAENFKSTSERRSKKFEILGNGRSAKFAWQTQDLNLAGAVGDARAATAEKGQKLLAEAARSFAVLLGEIHQLPLSLIKRKVTVTN